MSQVESIYYSYFFSNLITIDTFNRIIYGIFIELPKNLSPILSSDIIDYRLDVPLSL